MSGIQFVHNLFIDYNLLYREIELGLLVLLTTDGISAKIYSTFMYLPVSPSITQNHPVLDNTYFFTRVLCFSLLFSVIILE